MQRFHLNPCKSRRAPACEYELVSSLRDRGGGEMLLKRERKQGRLLPRQSLLGAASLFLALLTASGEK